MDNRDAFEQVGEPAFRIIASVYRSLLEILAEAGRTESEINDRIGADVRGMVASKEMLDLNQVTTLWQLGFESRGAVIGIEVASRVRLVDYQDVGVYLTATEDVADVLQQLSHYCALFSNVVEASTTETDQGIAFSLDYKADVPLLHERLDFLLASGPVLISQYLGSPLQLLSAELPRPKPPNTQAWENLFGVDIIWGAPTARYLISRDEARRRVLTRNALLRQELQYLLDRRLRGASRADPLAEIRAVMTEQLAHRVPCMDSVTGAMHVSARTLQRRLAESGTSFSDLLATLRREMAENQLKLGMTPTEVAERLGYSDTKTFIRAFRRWHGQTPAQYQKDLASAASER